MPTISLIDKEIQWAEGIYNRGDLNHLTADAVFKFKTSPIEIEIGVLPDTRLEAGSNAEIPALSAPFAIDGRSLRFIEQQELWVKRGPRLPITPSKALLTPRFELLEFETNLESDFDVFEMKFMPIMKYEHAQLSAYTSEDRCYILYKDPQVRPAAHKAIQLMGSAGRTPIIEGSIGTLRLAPGGQTLGWNGFGLSRNGRVHKSFEFNHELFSKLVAKFSSELDQKFHPYLMLLSSGVPGLYLENRLVIFYTFLEKHAKPRQNLDYRHLAVTLGWTEAFSQVFEEARNYIVHGNGGLSDFITVLTKGVKKPLFEKLPDDDQLCIWLGAYGLFHLIETRVKNSILNELGLNDRVEFVFNDLTFVPN